MDFSVLLLCTATAAALGGAENHSLTLYKHLLKDHCNATMVVTKHSPMEKKLKGLGLPYVTTSSIKRQFCGIPMNPDVTTLLKICESKKITVIQCNEDCEIVAAKKVVKKHPAKIVVTRHVLKKLKKNLLKGTDVFIGVSKPIVGEAKKYHSKTILIPPLYDVEKFLTFTATGKKEEFLKDIFGGKTPLHTLCMIANLSKPKNHALLFRALHKIVYEKNRDVKLLLAGKGPLQNSLKNLAKKLKLTNHIHFLGFTNKVPEILSYSDINVLPSKQEGLGIALLESSLMKTPSIAANGTGMSDVIQHNKTGLLFKNNNIDDLVEKILQLIGDKKLAKKLGVQAHNFVKKNFLPETNFQKYLKIYTEA